MEMKNIHTRVWLDSGGKQHLLKDRYTNIRIPQCSHFVNGGERPLVMEISVSSSSIDAILGAKKGDILEVHHNEYGTVKYNHRNRIAWMRIEEISEAEIEHISISSPDQAGLIILDITFYGIGFIYIGGEDGQEDNNGL